MGLFRALGRLFGPKKMKTLNRGSFHGEEKSRDALLREYGTTGAFGSRVKKKIREIQRENGGFAFDRPQTQREKYQEALLKNTTAGATEEDMARAMAEEASRRLWESQLANRGLDAEGLMARGLQGEAEGNLALALTAEDQWIFHGEVLAVGSAHVEYIQYIYAEQVLHIGFWNKDPKFDGRWYMYMDIPETMARSFYSAGSYGKWVWDNLRVRGTVYGTRKPYGFLDGPSGTSAFFSDKQEPAWHTTAENRQTHAEFQNLWLNRQPGSPPPATPTWY